MALERMTADSKQTIIRYSYFTLCNLSAFAPLRGKYYNSKRTCLPAGREIWRIFILVAGMAWYALGVDYTKPML